MSSLKNKYEISIILEWENVLLSEDDRCFEMLEQLRQQIEASDYQIELLVLFNPEQIERTEIEKALETYLGAEIPCDVRLEEKTDTHYYQLKNEGAALARGQIIIFIDSDVVPEAGWLHEISQPFFDRPDIDVVAGQTYLAHNTFIEKVFALGWFFPLRGTQNRLHSEWPHFFANNVAFRRDLFLKFQFPEMPAGVTRGSCSKLKHNLVTSGITIWTNTAARADHPPPNGFRHYVKRALAHGRDLVFLDGRQLISPAKSLKWSVMQTVRAGRRIFRQQQSVGMQAWQTPLALLIMAGFYSMAFLGGTIALVAPGYATEHWQI